MINREYSSFFIDGSWRPGSSNAVMEVISPRSEERIGYVPNAGPEDVDAAVQAARRAFDDSDWASRPMSERAELCERLAAIIATRADELAELITEETGSPLLFSQVYQAVSPTVSFNYYAQLGRSYRTTELRVSDLSSMTGGSAGGSIVPFNGNSLIVKEPRGVVVAITPFNVPLPLAAQKSAPALIAGCTVVLKTPDPNPLAVFALGEMLDEAGFPPGVVNILAGDAAASENLIRHPGVDMVSFTGSTAVGARIAEICGALVKPVVLELGGKSPAILLDDADLDLAVPILVGCSVGGNNGESCVAMSRILAPASRYDEIAEAFADAIGPLKVGDPMELDTIVGPVVTARQRERVEGFIESGRAEGAQVKVGGRRPAHLQRGWYVEPTLLTDVTNEMRVAREEIFGPVTTLISYETEEEAVRIANDTEFGLAGTVWTADWERGFDVARRVRSGTFCVNTYAADLNSPFGGFKKSGIGREMGVEGLEEYLQPKTISIDASVRMPPSVLADLEPEAAVS